MNSETKKKKAKNTQAPSDRALINPEEWKDPAGRKVISEYHKDAVVKTAEQGDISNTNSNSTQKIPVLDLSTLEMIAYALSRSVFRKGVKIPVKLKDVVDMDVAVKDTDIILNTNDVSFELPPLQIWHVVFSYKGKPVFEFGRGVNNNLKIHYRHAFPFLIAMWLGGRRRRKVREKATEKACMDLANCERGKR